MTGLARKGLSIRLARTMVEASVLGVGWILGGTVGIGTLLYAACIGPLAHYFLPRLTVRNGTSGALTEGLSPRNPGGLSRCCSERMFRPLPIAVQIL
jgi:hypothetical protein